MKITKLQKWLLRKIARKIVRQGPYHADNILEYFRIIHEEARREFSEDNWHTLNAFLLDQYDEAGRYTAEHLEGTIMIVREQ